MSASNLETIKTAMSVSIILFLLPFLALAQSTDAVDGNASSGLAQQFILNITGPDSIAIAAGDTGMLALIVASNITAMNTSLTATGVAPELVNITPTSADIAAGDYQIYLVSLTVPENAVERTCTMTFTAKSDTISATKGIELVVTAPVKVLPEPNVSEIKNITAPENVTAISPSASFAQIIAQIKVFASYARSSEGLKLIGILAGAIIVAFMVKDFDKRREERKPWKIDYRYSPDYKKNILDILKRQIKKGSKKR